MYSIGLMSGTSLDGIDCSIIDTDGENQIKLIDDLYFAYPCAFQRSLRKLLTNFNNWMMIERELTNYHAECVGNILAKTKISASEIEVIGFHGQTIYHNQQNSLTWQIGNPHQLSSLTGIKVVGDFRRRDMAFNGCGAPLMPIYHKAITTNCDLPVCILNIGGVSNITYIDDNELIAFDIGPGNALINDMMLKYYKKFYDNCGNTALSGTIDEDVLQKLLNNKFFNIKPPKSLDRNEFEEYRELIKHLSPKDAIATLTRLTAEAIVKSIKFLPKVPKEIYVAGGGLKNNAIMNSLILGIKSKYPSVHVNNINELGLDPDFIESQGFAYLAARCVKGLSSSFAGTTSVCKDTVAGVIY